MSQQDTIIHLLAGGIGGTAGAIATCPLEVVKTRLQSSVASFHSLCVPTGGQSVKTHPIARFSTCATCNTTVTTTMTFAGGSTSPSLGLFKCLKHIIETEGARALFKGLGPNLVGVAPSRAIYFWSYSNAKNFFNVRLNPETPLVHICSAACAGFTACTVTNPIWFIKTRLQLDQSLCTTRKDNRLTTLQCIKQIYKTNGLIGFYKGITASYFGISETVVHFVIYEYIKSKLLERRGHLVTDVKTTRDFVEFMFAGALSKTCASILAYPHEVARTRLRQEGDKYRAFWQTLATVFREEGHRGLYRGLTTQLVRQIPNTAIMMATYEAVVYLFTDNTFDDSLECCEGDDY